MAKIKATPIRKDLDDWLKDQCGWFSEMEADGMDVDLASAAWDIADSILAFPDPDAKAAINYLRSTGVEDLKGCLADYLADVAY